MFIQRRSVLFVDDLHLSHLRCHHVKAAAGEDIVEECNPSHRCPQQGAFKLVCLCDEWETCSIISLLN